MTYPVQAADLCKVVLSLLYQPDLPGAAENLREPHGHFRRYAAFPIYEFRKRVARHSKASADCVMVKPERLNTPRHHDKAGVRRVFHGHRGGATSAR